MESLDELAIPQSTLNGTTTAMATEQQLLITYSLLIFIASCFAILLVVLAVYLYRQCYMNWVEHQLDKREKLWEKQRARPSDIFEKRVEFFPPSYSGTAVLPFAAVGGTQSIVFSIPEKSRVQNRLLWNLPSYFGAFLITQALKLANRDYSWPKTSAVRITAVLLPSSIRGLPQKFSTTLQPSDCCLNITKYCRINLKYSYYFFFSFFFTW